MSNFVKSTNFASKDSLPLGDPAKIVKGTEIDTEFNNIAVAVATKADTLSPALTGTPTAPTAVAGTNTTQLATTAFVQQAQANVNITGGSITGITDLAVADGGTGASTAAAAFDNLKQAATDSYTGVVELATTAEASAGTDSTRAVTAAGVEAHMNANAIGWGQSWQDVTGSRASATTYTNSTGRPIMVAVTSTSSTSASVIVTVAGGEIIRQVLQVGGSVFQASASFIVPDNVTYSVAVSPSISNWRELR